MIRVGEYRVVLQSCSHCGELGLVDERTCRTCRHRIDLPRMLCDCPSCEAWSRGDHKPHLRGAA